MKNSKDFIVANKKIEFNCVYCNSKISTSINKHGMYIECKCSVRYKFILYNQDVRFDYVSFYFDENFIFPLRKNYLHTNICRLEICNSNMFLNYYKNKNWHQAYKFSITDDFNIDSLMNIIKKYDKKSYFA